MGKSHSRRQAAAISRRRSPIPAQQRGLPIRFRTGGFAPPPCSAHALGAVNRRGPFRHAIGRPANRNARARFFVKAAQRGIINQSLPSPSTCGLVALFIIGSWQQKLGSTPDSTNGCACSCDIPKRQSGTKKRAAFPNYGFAKLKRLTCEIEYKCRNPVHRKKSCVLLVWKMWKRIVGVSGVGF